jgi:hypothetical protein
MHDEKRTIFQPSPCRKETKVSSSMMLCGEHLLLKIMIWVYLVDDFSSLKGSIPQFPLVKVQDER